MGVLDDAIREHLELKRRHGVGEDELRRQEEEALGPARREVAPAESDDGDQVEAAHPDEPELSEVIPAEAVQSDVHAEEPEEPAAELPVEEPVAEAAAPEVAPPEEEHVPPPEDEHVELGDTPQQGFERVEEDEEPADDDFDDLEDDDGHPGEAEDDEYGSEDDEDADVLEDTPDFLQETPEHDRLWFEQKPPRDFDFD
jgi:hypothetical protein